MNEHSMQDAWPRFNRKKSAKSNATEESEYFTSPVEILQNRLNPADITPERESFQM